MNFELLRECASIQTEPYLHITYTPEQYEKLCKEGLAYKSSLFGGVVYLTQEALVWFAKLITDPVIDYQI